MKITVTNAQLLIEQLQKGIYIAMKSGAHEFEFTAALQADDDAARQELASAITAAQKPAPDAQTIGQGDVGDVADVLDKNAG